MVAKDLNLSLKQRPVQPKDNPISGRSSAEPTAIAKHSAVSPKNRQAKASNRNNKGLWIGFFVIAFANMLFLLLAGIWLSGLPLGTSIQTTPIAAQNASEITLTLTGVNRRLDAISEALLDLQVTAKIQPQAAVSEPLDINRQIRQALADHYNSGNATAAKTESAAPISWRVNLGTFSNRKEALNKQQKIESFGYHAKINPIARDTQTIFEVVLTGFSNRESAEQVANQIMERANLDSLWVSESS